MLNAAETKCQMKKSHTLSYFDAFFIVMVIITSILEEVISLTYTFLSIHFSFFFRRLI